MDYSLDSLSKLKLAELDGLLETGELTSTDLVESSLAQIEAVNGDINAVSQLQNEKALVEAKAATERAAKGERLSSLDGIPVTLKDSVDAIGMRWFHGSAGHAPGRLAADDSPSARNLRAAGTITLGKTSMPDFGLSGSGVSSLYGIVRNPWGLGWNTGGSSAGAGASLAAGIGFASIGSDIAGSVRFPASHCGLASIKPTTGLIAHMPPSPLRSVGPIARHAEDLEILLRTLSGADNRDRYSMPLQDPETDPVLTDLRVGIVTDFGFGPEVEEAVVASVAGAGEALSSLGIAVENLSRPFGFDGYAPFDDLLKRRGWHEYMALPEDQRSSLPDQLIEWFKPAASWGIDKIQTYETGMDRIVLQTQELMDGVDVLLTPVMPIVNFPADELGIDEEMPLRHSTFTAPFNLSGQPAAVLRGGFDQRGLPIGIQLVARRFDDIMVLRLAAALEDALRAHQGEVSWPIVPVTNNGGHP